MIDAALIPVATELEAEVCVVGSGPAALATATRLVGVTRSMIILEAGYPRHDRVSQGVYRGLRVGDPMHPPHRSRDRRFGGTGSRWAGRTRPFDREDFEARRWMSGSGWPISRDDLDAYYREAARFCRVSIPSDEEWREGLPSAARMCSPDLMIRRLGCEDPVDFGTAYRPPLERAASTRLLVGASVVALRASPAGERIERLDVARRDGARFAVRAEVYVIACGGIENARLLMVSDDVAKQGVGNHSDQVGRCFMDHPTANAAVFHPGRCEFPVERFRFIGPGTGKTEHGQICLSRAMRERQALPGAAASFSAAPPPHTRAPAYGSRGVRAAREVLADLRCGEWPANAAGQLGSVIRAVPQIAATVVRRLSRGRPRQVGLRVFLEQLPDPDNRIVRTRSRDRFGVPRVELRWRIGEAEKRSFDRLCDLLAEEFDTRDMGRLDFIDPIAPGGWPPTLSSACHHMGTTRMSGDPSRGVVDSRGRVHGVRNLYIAGSSVFPTGGSANPTLTIVALSLRLGDEIARRLQRPAVVGSLSGARP